MIYQSYKPRRIRPRITLSLNEILIRLLVIGVAVPEAEELETLAVLRTEASMPGRGDRMRYV